MEYVGLQTQIWRNNTRSIVLLILFPLLLLSLTYAFFTIFEFQLQQDPDIDRANNNFLVGAPFVAAAVAIWFLIAWWGHSGMIRRATGSKPLERKENKRVYNLVENLCIAEGMSMPKVNVIEDNSLNAFASGINEKTYTVSLSRGIIEKLDDAELEGVIAHELSHIRNRDVRLLIVSIIFVGVFAFIAEAAFRATIYGRGGRNKKGGGAIVLIMVLGILGYIISLFLRFAISRKREFMADAGAAQMTKDPKALARALRKVSQDPKIEAVKRDDVAQLFIDHPSGDNKKGLAAAFAGLFATHPPIEKRIALLEQF